MARTDVMPIARTSTAEACQPLISLDCVVREVEGPRQQRKTLLNGVSWSLYAGDRVAILSSKRSEADAFLDCACGVTAVQSGSVTIQALVSWPLGRPAALLAGATARQNANFLLKIYGDPSRHHEQMETIMRLSDLESDYFDRPIRSYNSAMKARFRLAISMVFHFDVYAVPYLEGWSYGAKSVRARNFRALFEEMTDKATLMVTNPDEEFQKAYCTQGIVLANGCIAHQGDLESCQAFLSGASIQAKPTS